VHKILLLGACLLAAAWLPAHADECLPEGHDKASLQALKAAGFVLPDAAARRALAVGLVACLADPDPELRDGIAYEALTAWMRNGDFDTDTLRALRDRLYPMLEAGDDPGFAAPFAALVLSEVARTDRVAPWMAAGERTAMVERAASYVESVRDYRGYVEGQGWRHGVAHGADWLMQLSLDPALERAQLDRILAAVASQVAPMDGPAYVFGEPARLARPVLFVAQRQSLSPEDWQAWFARLPTGVAETREQDFARWLARRHDLMAFLTGLYLQVDQSSDPGIQGLKPAIEAALKAAGGPS
jgi:hypothetical protein